MEPNETTPLFAGIFPENSAKIYPARPVRPAGPTRESRCEKLVKTQSSLATRFPWSAGKLPLVIALSLFVEAASVSMLSAASDTFAYTGSLNTARALHTATLLPNGKVLVAGGTPGSGSLSSAEMYDPETGTWTNTDSLNTARYNHTATLLPNGKVLVAGGFDFSLTSAEGTTSLPGAGVPRAASPPGAFAHGDVAAQRQGAGRSGNNYSASL